MPFVSFAFTHALRAQRRTIYAPPELNISAHGKALIYNNFYCITENYIKLANLIKLDLHQFLSRAVRHSCASAINAPHPRALHADANKHAGRNKHKSSQLKLHNRKTFMKRFAMNFTKLKPGQKRLSIPCQKASGNLQIEGGSKGGRKGC